MEVLNNTGRRPLGRSERQLVAFGRPKMTAEGQVPWERALVVVDGRSRNRS